MKLIKMPSIEQFRSAIYNITKAARFEGLDENDQPTYNNDPLPCLDAIGTVKLHGTNASVCFNTVDGIWAQSKKNVITVESDNAGFAFFVQKNKNVFMELLETICTHHPLDMLLNTVTIYGEWAGKGIQKNVGIAEIDKKFYIFGIKITPHNEDVPAYWIDSNIFDLKDLPDIYHIAEFGEFKLNIDFNNPLLSNNKMVEMVQGVENECPVAKHFGISGTGEGIVFTTEFKGNTYRWKMKGDKHAGKSKVKTAKKVDDEKLQRIIDVVDQVTPEWRLEQMFQETFDIINGGKGDIKKTGDYLSAVIRDIMKEELDTIADAGLIPKDINSSVSKKARIWFFKKLNEEAGLIG